MFTDIEGYTSMVQENETDAIRKVEKHRRVIEGKAPKHGGEVVEFYGDGSLSIFSSVLEAVKCAINMQKAFLEGDKVPVVQSFQTQACI